MNGLQRISVSPDVVQSGLLAQQVLGKGIQGVRGELEEVALNCTTDPDMDEIAEMTEDEVDEALEEIQQEKSTLDAEDDPKGEEIQPLDFNE